MARFLKDPWFLMSAALVVILGASMFVFSFSSGETKSAQENSNTATAVTNTPPRPLSNVEISPQPFEFGDVSMKKGIVSQTFSLKNKTGGDLKVARIETSCMCTEASMKIGDKESPYFGMPGHTFNPGWQETLSKDGEASVNVKYDPAAHGPSGTGLAKRVVRVFFADPPNTYSDINFSANVIN